MTLPVIFDRPQWTHRLAAVLRFVDHFTGAVVRHPLSVSTLLPPPPPRLRAPVVDAPPSPLAADPQGSPIWRAIRVVTDDTYRFFLTDADIPTGTFAVNVEDPLGRYVSLEPFSIVLPRPRTPPPPPAIRGDFLVDVPLWPTVRAPVSVAETAVTGRIVRTVGPNSIPVPGFRVRLFALPGLPPAAPYTRSDERGEFTFRFPTARRLAGPPPVTTATFGVEVRDLADAVVASTPSTVTLPMGGVASVEITVP